jgi:hypothetical protein
MPLDHTAARKLALLLYDEPLVKVTELKRVADDVYRIRFVDRRDGRTHTILEPGQIATWLDSIVAGRVLQPTYGVCEVCDCLHSERDREGELRLTRCSLSTLFRRSQMATLTRFPTIAKASGSVPIRRATRV